MAKYGTYIAGGGGKMIRVAKTVVKHGLSKARRAKQIVVSNIIASAHRKGTTENSQSVERAHIDALASLMFDAQYYLSQNPDVAVSGVDPLNHYLKHGRYEQRRAHPLFDPVFYLDAYADVRDSGIASIDHFLLDGANEGRNPHPLFDTKYYLGKYPDVADGGMNPIVHYAYHGASEGRRTHPLFDPAYYRSQYVGEVAQVYLIEHYRTSVSAAFNSPHRLFDTAYYLSQSGPIYRNTTPLEHYLSTGCVLGYSPHPLFDSAYYLATNPDVASSGINPLVHYIQYGSVEDRTPHPFIHPKFYRQQSGFALAEITTLEHLIQTRNQFPPHPLFCPSYYLNQIDPAVRHRIFALNDYCVSIADPAFFPHPFFRSIDIFRDNANQSANRTKINELIYALASRQRVSCAISPDTWSNQLFHHVGDLSSGHLTAQMVYDAATRHLSSHACHVAMCWLRNSMK